jgi:hypothetical protein
MSFSCHRLILTHLGCARSITDIKQFSQKVLKGETHEISNLKVVFLDDQSIQDMWKSKTGKPGRQFQPWLRGNLASVKTVRGFYDFSSQTLYCPKWNYEVCGHELHHAALGRFHPQK